MRWLIIPLAASATVLVTAGRSSASLYWTSQTGGWGDQILRANVGEPGSIQVVVDDLRDSWGIGVDEDEESLYWFDRSRSFVPTIYKSAFDGSGVQELATLTDPGGGSLTNLRDVALDLTNNRMYWTDRSGRILQANLDGTQIETLFAFTEPMGISLDLVNQYLYWSQTPPGDSPGSIARGNVNAGTHESLTTVAGNVKDVDVAGGKIYWTDTTENSIMRSNLDGTSVETIISDLTKPMSLTVDSVGGDLIWAQWGESRYDGSIRRASLDGTNEEILFSGLRTPRDVELVSATFDSRPSNAIPAPSSAVCMAGLFMMAVVARWWKHKHAA